MNPEPCTKCRGEGLFLMMSEFYVPCTYCKGTGLRKDAA